MTITGIKKATPNDILSAREYNRLVDAVNGSAVLKSPQRPALDFHASIEEGGPNGEPDFADARYWVLQTKFTLGDLVTNALRESLGPLGDESAAPGTEPMAGVPIHVPALNVAELETRGHGLPPGTLVRCFEMADHRGLAFLAFERTVSVIEVEIERVVEVITDATEQEHADNLAEFGPHLSCFRVRSDNSLDVTRRIVVFPVGNLQVGVFKPGGAHVYGVANPANPRFMAAKTARGLILQFGEAMAFGPPPDPSNVCGANP